MKKSFILMISILIISTMLINCNFDNENVSAASKMNKRNVPTAQSETNKTSAEIASLNFGLQKSNNKEYGMYNVISTTNESTIISLISSFIAKMFSEVQTIAPNFKEQQERVPIAMISVYECSAFSYQQDIYVLDFNGFYYFYQAFEWNEKIDLKENGWYEKILEIEPITEGKYGEYYTQVEEETMTTIIDFTKHLDDYKDCTMKEYYDLEGYENDVTLSIYGIYYDKDKRPQNLKLCSYGDCVQCIDDKSVIDFINQISSEHGMDYIFYSDKVVKYPY